MSFQRCPVCDGAGYVGIGFPTGEVCSVCRGQKIINEQTGVPPYETFTTTGTGPIDFKKLGIQIDKIAYKESDTEDDGS
jgi:hypothetical protein